MKGAKPSSGLVHLHKSFVEQFFAGRRLPQSVSITAVVDGKRLDVVLPGQVYATSHGQDNWLLGLQFIFKAYKCPVITSVEKTSGSGITVAIASQGLQGKYRSCDPYEQAELQRALEAAAFKFAQAAMMRKEGRMQITGPNVNIPRKQLRAQWPAILEQHASQPVTAHIFVDTTERYMVCAAKIILTKAKAEPVFYLSGLSQLLKAYMGAYVAIQLIPDECVVRLHIDTGKSKSASISATSAATQTDQAEASSAAGPPEQSKADLEKECTASGGSVAEEGQAAGRSAGANPSVSKAVCGQAGGALDVKAPSCLQHQAHKVLPGPTAAGATAVTAAKRTDRQNGLYQHQRLDETTSRSLAHPEGVHADSIAVRQHSDQGMVPYPGAISDCSSLRQQLVTPSRSAGCCRSPVVVDAAAVAALAPPAETAHVPGRASAAVGSGADIDAVIATGSQAHVSECIVAAGSDAGLRLLADHAAQLQAAGSSGDLSMADATASAGYAQQREVYRSQDISAAGAREQSQATGHNASAAEAPVAEVHPGAFLPSALVATCSGARLEAGFGSLRDTAAGVAVLSSKNVQLQQAVSDAVQLKDKSLGLLAAGLLGDDSHTLSNISRLAAGCWTELLQQQASALYSGAQQSTCRARENKSMSDAGAAVDYLDSWRVHPKRRRTASMGVTGSASTGWLQQDQQQQCEGMHLCTADIAFGEHGRRAVLDSHEYWDGVTAALAAAGSVGPPCSMLTRPDMQRALLQQQQEQPHGQLLSSPSTVPLPCSSGTFQPQEYAYDPAFTARFSSSQAATGLAAFPTEVKGPLLGSVAAEGTSGTYHLSSPISNASSGTTPGVVHCIANASCSPAGAAPVAAITPSKDNGSMQAVSGSANNAGCAYTHDMQALPLASVGVAQTSLLQQHMSVWSPAAINSLLSPADQNQQVPAAALLLANDTAQEAISKQATSNAPPAEQSAARPASQHVDDAVHQQQLPPQLGGYASFAAGNDGWPVLPDADNLMAVGKALVQMMNFLGASSAARLALTRALRVMSPHDREWLLSITYPHLQDSCRRRAVPEMCMILSEVAGVDCFANAGESRLERYQV